MLYKKSVKMTSNSKQNTQKALNTEKQKSSFYKEQVENADLYKSVLSKVMMTTQK